MLERSILEPQNLGSCPLYVEPPSFAGGKNAAMNLLNELQNQLIDR